MNKNRYKSDLKNYCNLVSSFSRPDWRGEKAILRDRKDKHALWLDAKGLCLLLFELV